MFLYSKGLYYHNKFKKGYEKDLYEAVIDWEKWRKNNDLNHNQIKRVASYMSPDHYQKENLQYLNKDKSYNMTEAYNNQGLKTKTVWYEAFDSAPQNQIEYIRKMRANGEQLNKEPRILLSTIHGVKGGECSNVVLLTDLSRKYSKKVWIVFLTTRIDCSTFGATRTKDHLHIVRPKDIYKSFRI